MNRLLCLLLLALFTVQTHARCTGYILAKANRCAQRRLARCGGYRAVCHRIKRFACGRCRTVPQKALHRLVNQHAGSRKKTPANQNNSANKPSVKKTVPKKAAPALPAEPIKPPKIVDEPEAQSESVTDLPAQTTPSPAPKTNENQPNQDNNQQTPNNNPFANDQLLQNLQKQLDELDNEQQSGWQSWIAPGIIGIGALLGLYLLVKWFKQS